MRKKLFDIIKHNKLYTVLAVFVLLINLLILADRLLVVDEQSNINAEEARKSTAEILLYDEDAFRERQEKLEKLANEDPQFYMFLALVNFAVFFTIFAGIILDIGLVTARIRKQPFVIKGLPQESPGWNVADVFRVTLIFLSLAYLFMLLEGVLEKRLDIFLNNNFRMIFNTAIMNIACISVILFFVIKKYGQDLKTIGLNSAKFFKNIFYAVTGYIAFVPILILISAATFFISRFFNYTPPVQTIVKLFIEEQAASVLWISAIFAAIFGPIAEEIFFRGFMYRAFKKKIGILGSMFVTAAIFSLLHTHLAGFAPIMALGLLLAFLYEKTGSLVAPITVHIIHNLGMVGLVFLMRYIGV
ncbi:MAG: type II CAAX endopeptidase family protein [Candidatus Omnitrophota bacterium]